MSEIKRMHTGSRISRAVIHNKIVYLAGILALEKHGEVRDRADA